MFKLIDIFSHFKYKIDVEYCHSTKQNLFNHLKKEIKMQTSTSLSSQLNSILPQLNSITQQLNNLTPQLSSLIQQYSQLPQPTSHINQLFETLPLPVQQFLTNLFLQYLHLNQFETPSQLAADIILNNPEQTLELNRAFSIYNTTNNLN